MGLDTTVEAHLTQWGCKKCSAFHGTPPDVQTKPTMKQPQMPDSPPEVSSSYRAWHPNSNGLLSSPRSSSRWLRMVYPVFLLEYSKKLNYPVQHDYTVYYSPTRKDCYCFLYSRSICLYPHTYYLFVFHSFAYLTFHLKSALRTSLTLCLLVANSQFWSVWNFFILPSFLKWISTR